MRASFDQWREDIKKIHNDVTGLSLNRSIFIELNDTSHFIPLHLQQNRPCFGAGSDTRNYICIIKCLDFLGTIQAGVF